MSDIPCTQMGPHTHPICVACRQSTYGNLSCPDCKSKWQRWTKEDERTYGHGPSRFDDYGVLVRS